MFERTVVFNTQKAKKHAPKIVEFKLVRAALKSIVLTTPEVRVD